jgi:hypothetical protein
VFEGGIGAVTAPGFLSTSYAPRTETVTICPKHRTVNGASGAAACSILRGASSAGTDPGEQVAQRRVERRVHEPRDYPKRLAYCAEDEVR